MRGDRHDQLEQLQALREYNELEAERALAAAALRIDTMLRAAETTLEAIRQTRPRETPERPLIEERPTPPDTPND